MTIERKYLILHLMSLALLGVSSRAQCQDVATRGELSIAELGDSTVIHVVLDTFRVNHLPGSAPLRVRFMPSPNGTLAFFRILADVSGSAADSAKEHLTAALASPQKKWVGQTITLTLHDGSLRARKSVVTPPKLLNRDALARAVTRAGQKARTQGTMRIMVFVNEVGRVTETKVERSSGSRDLDVGAEAAVLNARFAPGKIDGSAISVWVSLPFVVRGR